MENTKHTPGPWEIEVIEKTEFDLPSPEYHVFRKIGKSYSIQGICKMHTWGNTIDLEMLANARLIAAAPELLAVCEMIAKLNDGQGRANLCEIAGAARAAISRATGE